MKSQGEKMRASVSCVTFFSLLCHKCTHIASFWTLGEFGTSIGTIYIAVLTVRNLGCKTHFVKILLEKLGLHSLVRSR